MSMVETLKIDIRRTTESRLAKTDFTDLPFGKVFADHMFMADFRKGDWGNFRAVPYAPMTVSPATPAIHYGQSIFEGLKVYRDKEGEVIVFRPLEHWKRMNISAERMCMPYLPEDVFMEGLRTLIDLDRDWVPAAEGSSLYIRPFMFSADEYIGIRPSQDFTFMIINSPVGPYYSTPVKVKIETHYTRAVEGGTGFAKAGGNYGGSLFPARVAQEQGYHQLIWTDGKEHKYVEESGTMNLMFVFDDTLVTPSLGDTILKGVTRDSVIALAKSWGLRVEERKVGVKELLDGLESGRVKEAFGAGTAATIAHIELIGYDGKNYYLPPVETRKVSNRILHELDGIKRGTRPDPFGWVFRF